MKFDKVFKFKILYLVIGGLLLFNSSLYSYPKDTLRVQSSFQDPENSKKIDEAFLREALKSTPVKEIALSAQFKVLTNGKLGIVVRIPKTREETRTVLIKWGFNTWMQEQDLERLIDRIHAGKEEGAKIFKEKLLYSKAVWGVIELADIEMLEETKEGNTSRTEKKVDIQKKADKVLWQAISDHYKKGEIDKIKEILNQLIQKTQEEIWSYGVYYEALSFSVNWGVDYLEDGAIDVRLFDFWEVTDNKEKAIERLKKHIGQFDKTWEIMGKEHTLSILNLTDEGIAKWFLERIKEEFTLDKLREYWDKKVGELETPKTSAQLLKIRQNILNNL